MTETKAYAMLREALEKKIGRPMESPTDFEILSHDISQKTGESVSASTLKRFFGYIETFRIPRPSTLSILARYVGKRGWNDFVHASDQQSHFLSDNTIAVSELHPGDRICFDWEPDRRCIALYLGENRFRVIHSEKAKIHLNDTFTATVFALHSPLYLTDLQCTATPDAPPVAYVAGSRTGLTHLTLQKADDPH